MCFVNVLKPAAAFLKNISTIPTDLYKPSRTNETIIVWTWENAVTPC